MDNEQAQGKEQGGQHEQQKEAQALLRSDRKARGDVRDAHLEAGCEQARQDNTRARSRNATETRPTEDKSDPDQEPEC